MSKFQVGDRVRVVGHPVSGMLGCTGTIAGVFASSLFPYNVECNGRYEVFAESELTSATPPGIPSHLVRSTVQYPPQPVWVSP